MTTQDLIQKIRDGLDRLYDTNAIGEYDREQVLALLDEVEASDGDPSTD